MSRNATSLISMVAAIVAIAFLAACNSKPAEPMPTRTPAPTFTPTPEIVPTPVDPAAAATALAAQPPPAQAVQPPSDQPAVQPPPTQVIPTDTPLPPPTPVPAAEVIINTIMNVRGGPGTNYNIIGTASAGDRYAIKGKNDAGSWWQIDYRGEDGWVFGDLVTAENAGSVAIAQNIPAPPSPTPVPPTQPPPPAATQPPAPPPEPSYPFNKAILQRCDPNAGVTYVEGTTYRNGQPTNGLTVVFSYAPDGPVVASVQSGPHEGYPGWRTGFYSHILSATGPREGDWYFWIVDSSGKRISKTAHVHTDGTAGDGRCQQAVIDFDS